MIDKLEEIKRLVAKKKDTSSKYSGVYWHKTMEKWCAKIKVSGVQVWLGSFDNEKQAAIRFQEAKKIRDSL